MAGSLCSAERRGRGGIWAGRRDGGGDSRGDLRGVKAGRDAGRAGRAGWVQLGGWCAARVRVRAVEGEGGGGRGGYQWGMVSAAEAAGKADILIKQPRAKSH